MKDLIQLTSTKTSTKDVIVIQGRYFEAKSLKEYLRLCKKVKQLDYFLTPEGTLKITHDSGGATFNQVGIDDIKTGKVTWHTHEQTYGYCDGVWGYKSGLNTKTGTLLEFTV